MLRPTAISLTDIIMAYRMPLFSVISSDIQDISHVANFLSAISCNVFAALDHTVALN